MLHTSLPFGASDRDLLLEPMKRVPLCVPVFLSVPFLGVVKGETGRITSILGL